MSLDKRIRSPAWHTPEGRSLRRLWTSMRNRCRDRRHPTFRLYGGRGVRLSPEWARYGPFYDWAIASGYRLGERLLMNDPVGDFSPENCRWGSARARMRERRGRLRPNGKAARLRAFGELKTVADWARDPRCVVSKWSLRDRLHQGVAPEAAIASPATSGIPLPKRKKPVVRKRVYAKVDWDRVLRLRKRGMTIKAIAARLGVPYTTVQAGLWGRSRTGRRGSCRLEAARSSARRARR